VTNQRLGIFGGTFDPPHLGHLILAETAADSLDLATVLFVPVGVPPHKAARDLRAPAHHRFAMVERAVADNARFAASRVDIDRPGPHYSVDMLRLLKHDHPDAEFFFLIGGDSLRDLPTWSRPNELLELSYLGVMRRPGTVPDLDDLDDCLPGIRERVRWVDAPLLDISATEIARRIAAGQSVRYRLPDSVCAYIEEHGLYRKEP
jgi:nicotinate-nucleotide adenylyltransferase